MSGSSQYIDFANRTKNTTLIKLSTSGSIIWAKNKLIPNTSDYFNGRDLIFQNGHYYLTGSQIISNGGNSDAFLMEVDANGNALWSSSFNGSYIDHSINVILHSNNNLYWGGLNRTFASGASTATIHCSNNIGNALWAKKYDIPNLADGFDGFVEADNGDILGLGRTDVNANADLYIIRVDAIGNLIWSKSLAGSDYDEGMSIKKMSGDSYIISGVTSSFGNGKQLFVTKINGQGNEIWTKIYGGQQDESVYAHPNMLAINESGGYGILVGSTQSYGGSDFDPYVIKFNLEEQDSCSTQGILWVEQTVNPIVQNISASSTSLGNFASYNMSETVNPMVIDTSCFAVCNSNSETSCTDLFQKYYDNSQDSKNISNYITSDGGYVIAGMTNSYGAGQEDIFVVKYNANNQVEWSNTYGTTSRELAGTAYIIQTTTNDYLVAFESTAYSNRTDAGGLVYMRLDATGNIVWQKAIDVSGSSYLHASSILEYNNEFYLMGSSGGGAQIYTLKIDGSGNRIWMKKLRFGSIEHGMRQILGNNGKIYGCGTTTAFGGGEKGVVYQLEPSNGNVDWVKTYDNYSGSYFYYSINKTPDNNIILTGASNGGNILTKIDYAGNIIWNKYFNQSGSEFGDEIMVSSDGSLYMAGKTNNIAGHGSYDVFVTKLDANGVEQWTKLYGGAAEEDIFHRDGFFKINENEGYGLLSYATRSYGGNDFDITITKLSLGTDTVCNEINTVLWNESNINITPVSRTFTEGIYPTEINANLSKLTMPITESVICEVLCNTQTNSNCDYLKTYNNYNTVNDIVYKSATNQLYMSGGTVNGNLFMANMETDGTTNWSREYAASAGTTSFIGTILFADNNSDILTVELKNDQAIIYRIDNAGNIVWNKRLQKGIIRRPKLVNAGNNEYYMVCWYAPSGSSDNLVVYKFDGNGNVLWSYQYDYSDDQFFRVISNGAGGLAMSGVLSSNPFLLEIDPNGNIIHSKIENSSTYSLYRSIFKDGNFYYAHGSDKSGSNAKIFIEKFDANFNPIWKQSTGWISNRDVYDGEILKDAFGNLYLYTPVYVGSTIQDELLIKFDASGNVLKEKTSTINNSLLLHGTIVPAASAEELIIAYTSPYFSNGNKVGIIKTDTALSSCILVDTTLAFGTVSSSMTTINFTRSNITLNVFNDIPTVNTLTVLTEIECEVNCDTPINPIVVCNNSSIDTLICLGDSLQIDLGAVSNISWTPNYNISDVNSANPIFWPETDTTYIVYYEDSVCQYFDTLHIQISSLDVEASFNDTTVCPNTNVQLNATGAVSYIWMPSANLNNANIADPIFNGNTTDTLIVIGQNSNGCEASDTVIINVLPCCGAFADFDISDSIICVNETVTFTNTSIEGTNPTFTWNFGTGASPATYVGQNPPAVTYTIPGMYQVQLILSDDCGQDTVLKNIYVNDIPLLNLAPDTNICGNDSVHYQLGDIGISDYTYIWTPTNGLDNPNIANPIASINYSETYTVVVTDNFTGCVNTDSVTIHFVYEPDSIIKYSATSICANDSVQLYVDAPNDSLIWSNGSQFDTLNFVLLQDTQITVRLFIEDCIFYDTLNIEVDTIPNVNLVFNDTVCINSWDTIHVQTTGIPVWESGDTATAYPVFIEQDTILYLTTYNGLCGIEDTIYIYTRDLPEDSITG
ncbi:MAG: PKD domain-containing protein [Chitinophagales bacterium]